MTFLPKSAADPDRELQRADQPVLSLHDVSVHFGGVAALSSIFMDALPNEVVAVVGPNGAGKSTLLNVISGLLHDRARGTITLYGSDVSGMPASRIARLGVGRSFQDPPLLDAESAVTNVMVGQHLRLRYRMGHQLFSRRSVTRLEAEATDRAVEALEFVGVGHLGSEPVGELAYGTRKLIDIARAIVSGPGLLLLDEPTSGLDGDEQAAVARMLAELHRSSPVAILLVEHHMEVVRAAATKVVGLHSGMVLMEGDPAEVLDSQDFLDAITGRTRLEGQEATPPSDEANQ